jgi:segregation and condensation protein A
MDITEVSLSKVTQQYLEAVNAQPNIDPYALADFLVISARLLYMKSKLLLPMLQWEEEQDTASLEDHLKMYKEYYNASRVIEKMLKAENFAYARERLAVDVEVLFNPPHNLTVHKLLQAMEKVIKEIEPIVRIPKRILRRTISIRDKINQVREFIMERITTNFNDLIQSTQDKTEAILTFLAMLELVKQRVITVDQEKLHGDINIEKL